MIQDRLYNPEGDELIYHYCDPNAFANIMQSRTMWHTAFSALNDSSERQWGLAQFIESADKQRGVCGAEFIDRIIEIVRLAQGSTVAMIASYSLNGDLLSQWRAYADDGRGFAIGFAAREMEMPAKPLRVLYDRAAQRHELVNNIRHAFEVEKRFGFRYDEAFLDHWCRFGLDLCAYKHPSFAEEKEIRRVHITGLALNESERRMIPMGAIDGSGARRSDPVPIRYRVRNGVQVPYVVLDITDNGKNAPVKEIILGPKNSDKEENVAAFLASAGWNGVKVRRSDAPYV
ncbi:DUF2971 domain-containing protein [Bradyrhizobium sp. SZCCHNR3015]|uniref:DUF2971 domain-containing protein n=1 Tax=Bradyrhizobium sp. SZCCHNR3015 TaxID=3057395 RepID=UPI002916E30A|nr:DUF2971 domain-containing protein [Bradyrhizobium sp. SZCCHNR3015]